MPVWRFLSTGPASGAFNMAVDEALLQGLSAGNAPPVLRVFGWDPPAISLGHSQAVDREVDVARCLRAGIDLVRRPTGGRAVLHWDELTYSVVCADDDPQLGGSVSDTYRRIGQCLVTGLRLFGVDTALERRGARQAPSRSGPGPRAGGVPGAPAKSVEETPARSPEAALPCFSSAARWEVKCRGRKLIGSAQCRVRGAILQHGSLLIGEQHQSLLDLLPSGPQRRRGALARQLAQGSIHLRACTRREIDVDELADCLAEGFRHCLGVEMQPDELTPDERRRAGDLMVGKYGGSARRAPAAAAAGG